MNRLKKHFFVLLAAFMLPGSAMASESALEPTDGPVLTALLHAFLAGASQNDSAVHDRFWSEQLVYTSSGGQRFGKAEIMESMDAPEEENLAVYAAEDIQIQQFGNTAVLAFRLVARSMAADSKPTYYFNTGTFVRNSSGWQAVAWQATRIPEEEKAH